ncbi:D-alanyl-D-alanine carboxypeptidase family protein [Methylomicrobium sp. Wu6]|uniref:D-alanyl-D-alanine carboxypeptidase family protein n=1 Tax=Methylomicrobium sp. Wu6 TaxID=3107928 RepID=UPI002DD6979D|nr:D-alanyl-D-alanine carboxypeptidase family protein [Methylomicrobium sp. Wu6]MEC4750378.1 D-alanyl-D-alanine carboxypeptidase family protein [Methylomicrobium sp. Wu6]
MPIVKLCAFALFAAVLQANAEAVEIETPAPPTIDAKAFVLQDAMTGKVLAENNADERLPPASLTKIMTVYVVFKELANGHLRLEDLATISKKAWGTSGSRMFVEVNAQVKIEDLLKGVIIQSGNDASVALAEHIAGDESTFADMMNQHAARLGMKNTHFKNADGLPIEDHYTSARDLAILTTALIKEFPQYYPWFSQKEFTYNNIVQHNRNLLLSRDSTVDGVKTGFTDDAGYCLVASALRNDMRLISVVMGTKSASARAVENQNLLNYGFRFFESPRLYEGKAVLSDARIWKGDAKTVPLGLAESLHATVPRGGSKDVKSLIRINEPIIAPIKEGDKLGTVQVTYKDKAIDQKDLVALKAVGEGNMFRKLFDGVLMRFAKSDGK